MQSVVCSKLSQPRDLSNGTRRLIEQLQMLAPGITQPLLAVSLLPPTPNENDRKPRRIGCGIKDIDDALRGGLDPGCGGGVTCVSGEKGVGKTGLAFAFLTTHLLCSSTNQAVLVDTTGTFDVLRLYNTILSQLRYRSTQDGMGAAAENLESAAAEVLDRVKIMRVFDFVGIVEAVAEVRDKLESQKREQELREKRPEPAPATVDIQSQEPQRRESGRKLRRIRSIIPDSEDEEEDEDVMLYDEAPDDEMLLDKPLERAGNANEVETGLKHAAEDGEVGMIAIDNITHVVGPMMKTNYVQASALLTSFLRSLSHLTKSHSLSTVLINAATTITTARPSAPSTSNPPQHNQNHVKNPLSSIFASAGHISPALSPLLPAHADLHILVTMQPLARQDAHYLQSFSSIPSTSVGSKSERVSVAEVLSDRYDDRVGRWAAFSVGEAGLICGVEPQRGIERKQYRLPGFASKVVL